MQIVVVYKVDRLTRSLADFAKISARANVEGSSFKGFIHEMAQGPNAWEQARCRRHADERRQSES